MLFSSTLSQPNMALASIHARVHTRTRAGTMGLVAFGLSYAIGLGVSLFFAAVATILMAWKLYWRVDNMRSVQSSRIVDSKRNAVRLKTDGREDLVTERIQVDRIRIVWNRLLWISIGLTTGIFLLALMYGMLVVGQGQTLNIPATGVVVWGRWVILAPVAAIVAGIGGVVFKTPLPQTLFILMHGTLTIVLLLGASWSVLLGSVIFPVLSSLPWLIGSAVAAFFACALLIFPHTNFRWLDDNRKLAYLLFMCPAFGLNYTLWLLSEVNGITPPPLALDRDNEALAFLVLDILCTLGAFILMWYYTVALDRTVEQRGRRERKKKV